MSSEIQEVAENIKSVASEIQELKTLLKKRTWDIAELDEFGSKDHVRNLMIGLEEKERLLLQAKNQLMEKETQDHQQQLLKAVSLNPAEQFKVCDEPFFTELALAKPVGDDLVFNHPIPSSDVSLTEKKLNKIYIRESYKIIAAGIVGGKNTITGTPGIGKSMFMIYLLWKLLKEGKRVLFIYYPFQIYYDGNGNVFDYGAALPVFNNRGFWNKHVVLFIRLQGERYRGSKGGTLSILQFCACNIT